MPIINYNKVGVWGLSAGGYIGGHVVRRLAEEEKGKSEESEEDRIEELFILYSGLITSGTSSSRCLFPIDIDYYPSHTLEVLSPPPEKV